LKRFIAIVLCLVTIFASVVIINAENSVSVRSGDVKVNNNRLFDVDIYVDSSFSFTAATFEFSYDNRMMEYREVSTEVSGGMVRATDKESKVKAIFLKNDGVSANGEVKLFSVKFKSIAEGSCNVAISMYDVVDNNAMSTNNETSTQIVVSVSGGKSSVIIGSDEKDENNDEPAEKETAETKIIKQLSIATPKDSSQKYLIMIILLMIGLLVLLFYCAKLKKDKEKVQEKLTESKGIENVLIKEESKEKSISEEDSSVNDSSESESSETSQEELNE